MERIEKYDATPDKSLFPKLGQTGYTVAEALAELIDNSIDARDEKVNISIKIDRKTGKVSIEDNGFGMNKDKARESIILGRSNKKQGELGQFGIGLKTACMSLGMKFTVETTQRNSDELYIVEFDEEEFLKKGSWSDFEIKIKSGTDKNKSGTKVLIEKLRIRIYPNTVEAVKKHLTERFAPFITNKEAKITLNGSSLEPEVIKVIPSSKNDFIVELSNGSIVKGWTGILEVGSLERSGFNLYRYGRLIRAHEKLGYVYHPSKMWISGEVFMDPLPVTHNKREFITEDPLYVEFFDKFIEILKPVLAEAQKKHREEKIKELPPEVKETLKDNLLKAMEKLDVFRELAFPSNNTLSKRSKDGTGTEAEIEKREDADEPITEIKEEPQKNQTRTPHKTQSKKARFITIAGKKYQFDWEWQQLEDNIPKMSFLDKENGLIRIILNSNYKLVNVVKTSDIFYTAIYVMEGIVEVFLKENGQSIDKMIGIRDEYAVKLADVMTDEEAEEASIKDSNILQAQSYLLKQKNTDEKLTENEKKALQLRLEKGLTLQEVANNLGVTRQRADQLVQAGIRKINDLQVNEDKVVEVKEIHAVLSKEEDSVVAIISNVSENYGISIEELLGSNRQKELVLPRHIVMYLLRKKLKLPFPKIAEIMKKSDHTTIMHACEKIDQMVKDQKIIIA